MSYYKEYISGLCPESESWVVDQICDEIDSRDDAICDLESESSRMKEHINYLNNTVAQYAGKNAELNLLKHLAECEVIDMKHELVTVKGELEQAQSTLASIRAQKESNC